VGAFVPVGDVVGVRLVREVVVGVPVGERVTEGVCVGVLVPVGDVVGMGVFAR